METKKILVSPTAYSILEEEGVDMSKYEIYVPEEEIAPDPTEEELKNILWDLTDEDIALHNIWNVTSDELKELEEKGLFRKIDKSNK